MVAESFVKTLLAIQHHRISYPGYDFNKATTQAARNIDTNQKIGAANPIPVMTDAAPQTLGPQAPRSGLLASGYDADLITLDANPLEDLAVFADPSRITGVWLHGRRVKG